ncbi:histidinol dehydrogenase [Sphingomonas sp. LY29]|uniref:histidinol dehydrogenase n=1 Tax=Sphingomonas sp. LY29 TaxID=3095341 RepID=UPI002D7673E0|nr:histidinol dehydrogenase [Sphingomonas sp. LY29]WRP26296.1 histidinol dehydrogenase [Sphingomonas sp. LY29]
MSRFDWVQTSQREEALARPRGRGDAALRASVMSIVDDVRDRGWDAVVDVATRIDGAAPKSIEVAPFADEARRILPAAAQEAMRLAARAIETFHRQTLPRNTEVITYPGLSVSKLWRPLSRAGLYVPGGKAPLFSTLLMLAIPARVAGVRELVVVTPPRAEGGLDPAIALAAEIAGIDAIWTIGGAQAVAALAFGAGDIPAVDIICGPGNSWVSTAKSLVASMAGGPGIDLPAGPSELMVIADDSSDPVTVAADLLSQAEHDREAQVIVVSPSGGLLDAVAAEVDRQSAMLTGDLAPTRYVLCFDLEEAVSIANLYAPEHLSLACDGAAALVPAIRNAGAVFVGHQAAESFGDYLAGSSHVLPTDGAARFSGGVSTLTFMKAMTVQSVSKAAASSLAIPAAALARLEGLEAHARAAEARAVA